MKRPSGPEIAIAPAQDGLVHTPGRTMSTDPDRSDAPILAVVLMHQSRACLAAWPTIALSGGEHEPAGVAAGSSARSLREEQCQETVGSGAGLKKAALRFSLSQRLRLVNSFGASSRSSGRIRVPARQLSPSTAWL